MVFRLIAKDLMVSGFLSFYSIMRNQEAERKPQVTQVVAMHVHIDTKGPCTAL